MSGAACSGSQKAITALTYAETYKNLENGEANRQPNLPARCPPSVDARESS